MANKLLKKSILEAVENQLRLNEPKCAKEAFERLKASGVEEYYAKEMIGAVLIEEMYHVLKNDKPFNEQRYAQRLHDLKEDSLIVDNGFENLTIQELIESIEYNDGTFPEGELEEIIRRRGEAVPVLLDILEKVCENPQSYINDGDYFAHTYAAYLLSQFRVTEAYPVFIKILRLPVEMPHDLFGDLICEVGSRILASICGNDLNPIKEIIVDKQVDQYVRSQAVEALAILTLHGSLPREEVLEYYRSFLTEGVGDGNKHVMAEIVSSCNKLYPAEVMDEIRAAYRKGLVDTGFIGLDYVERTLLSDKEETLGYYREYDHHQFIDDTIDELKGWACFHDEVLNEDEEADMPANSQTVVKGHKTGRNDPCPCGSGKKYKKCCGIN